jgi:hypothetical protein
MEMIYTPHHGQACGLVDAAKASSCSRVRQPSASTTVLLDRPALVLACPNW